MHPRTNTHIVAAEEDASDGAGEAGEEEEDRSVLELVRYGGLGDDGSGDGRAAVVLSSPSAILT